MLVSIGGAEVGVRRVDDIVDRREATDVVRGVGRRCGGFANESPTIIVWSFIIDSFAPPAVGVATSASEAGRML